MSATPIEDKTRAARDARLRRMYGLTLEEWEQVKAAQGGGCAGCGRDGVTRSLHTDHDHKTRVTRGLLCPSCNSALRKLRDNPEIARALAAYLENPPAIALLGERQCAPVKRKRRTAKLKRKRAARKRAHRGR